MSMECKKPLRVSADAVAQAAQRGVARAIEARREAGVELSADDVNEVSGGILPKLIIAGGITPFPVYPPVVPGLPGIGGVTIA
jgi:hypothetical protein